MIGISLYYKLITIWIALAFGVFFVLLKVPVPYGRNTRSGWGPLVSAKWGWLLMESTASISLFIFYLIGVTEKGVVLLIFLLFWEIHYINRAFIYPLRIRGDRKQMTLSVIVVVFVFNIINGYFNGVYLFSISSHFSTLWLRDIRFIGGCILFCTGFAINLISDSYLRKLRNKNDKKYSIPNGFLFNVVSCPNYLGEIIEWLGWAILTWSIAGLSFFIWTAVNLIPRAISHHRWYKKKFSNYPYNRHALIPFVL